MDFNFKVRDLANIMVATKRISLRRWIMHQYPTANTVGLTRALRYATLEYLVDRVKALGGDPEEIMLAACERKASEISGRKQSAGAH